MIKPPALKPGDRIAAVSLSWGGPGAIPIRYEAGKRQLEQTFGVELVAAPHALREPEWIQANPAARADDLMWAFQDPSIAAVVSTIGGDDSNRLLPFLDLETLTRNPKVFIGYSDTTVTHLACLKAGLVSFYGPAIMSGFGENGGLFPYMVESVRRVLFQSDPIGPIPENREGWTVERLEWTDPNLQNQKRKCQQSEGWRYLQGSGLTEGRLVGGCLDVLDWMIDTDVWPDASVWEGVILFIETSEMGVPPEVVSRFLRRLSGLGILQSINGILFGRPGGHKLSPDEFDDYDDAILSALSRDGIDIPVITRMDFGHTDPMFVLPYGVSAQIDSDNHTFTILESAVTASAT